MFVLSVTRLHLRSLRFLPSFMLYTWGVTRQLRSSAGFLQARFANELPYAFWTMTAWTDLAAMHRFRDEGSHRGVMKKLLNWCDEASFTHWESADGAVPSPEAAHARLVASGRTSKLYHPSAAHLAGRTAADRVPTGGPLVLPKP
jgi:hypothetical protein